MPLRQHGYCGLLPSGRLIAQGRLNFPSQTRCIAGYGKARAGSETGPSPHHQTHKLISRMGTADKSHDQAAGSRPTASHEGSAKSQALSRLRDLELPTSVDSQLGRGAVSILERRDSRDPDRITEPVPCNSSARVERKKSKFAHLERRKEDKSLLNRVLKDKSYFSHDWRIPHRLLERYGTLQIFQDASQERNLFRKVIQAGGATSEQENQVLLRRIRTLDKHTLRPAREIPRPIYWSESTVADYVEDLVQYQYLQNQVPDVVQRRTRGGSNIADIITAYNEVFHTAATRQFISVAAYNTAFRFYSDYGIFSKARDLFFDMEDSKMDIPRKTFNILLRGAATSKDLHNFTFMLQRAIERGFKPDLETWNMLIMAIRDHRVRAVIIQSLRDRLIFYTSPIKRGNKRIIIQNEVAYRIEKHGDRENFLDYMDDRYGPKWVTTSTVNKLLYEFSKRKSIHETLGLLPGLKQRGFLPDEISLDTLLRHCLMLRQHKSAIETLEVFRYQFGLQPGKLAYDTLFLHARRSRLLNFARVIWRYACVYGFVTSKMRNVVFRSLLANAPAPAFTLRGIVRAKVPVLSTAKNFRELVGRFVVGVGEPQEAELAELAKLAELERTFKKWIFKTLKSSSRRKQQEAELAELELNFNHLTLETLEFGRRRWAGKLALIHLESDLRVAGNLLHIQQGFGNLLLQALSLDMLWVSQRKLRDATLQQVISDGIQLRPKPARSLRKLEGNLLKRVEVVRICRPNALSRPRERQPDRISPVNRKHPLGRVLRKNVRSIRRRFRTTSVLPRPPVLPLMGKKYSISPPTRKVLLRLASPIHTTSPIAKQPPTRPTLQKIIARKSSTPDGVWLPLISPAAREVSHIFPRKRPTKPSLPVHSAIRKLAIRKSLIRPVARKPWVKVVSRNHIRAVDSKHSVICAFPGPPILRKLALGASTIDLVVPKLSVRSISRMFSISIPMSQKPLTRPPRQGHSVSPVLEKRSVDHVNHVRQNPSVIAPKTKPTNSDTQNLRGTNIRNLLSGPEVPEPLVPLIQRRPSRITIRKHLSGSEVPGPSAQPINRSPFIIRKDLGKPGMLRKLLFVPRLPIRKEPVYSDPSHTQEHSAGPVIRKYTVKETSASREMASLHHSLNEILELDEALNKKS